VLNVAIALDVITRHFFSFIHNRSSPVQECNIEILRALPKLFRLPAPNGKARGWFEDTFKGTRRAARPLFCVTLVWFDWERRVFHAPVISDGPFRSSPVDVKSSCTDPARRLLLLRYVNRINQVDHLGAEEEMLCNYKVYEWIYEHGLGISHLSPPSTYAAILECNTSLLATNFSKAAGRAMTYSSSQTCSIWKLHRFAADQWTFRYTVAIPHRSDCKTGTFRHMTALHKSKLISLRSCATMGRMAHVRYSGSRVRRSMGTVNTIEIDGKCMN
jgi:hypothetical protein